MYMCHARAIVAVEKVPPSHTASPEVSNFPITQPGFPHA